MTTTSATPIRRILTRHWLERKKVEFELVPRENWAQYKLPVMVPDDERCTVLPGVTHHFPTVDPMDVLHRKYPLCNDLLSMNRGHMVLGGGFYTSVYDTINDLDFFLCDLTPEQADKMLQQSVELLLSRYEEHELVGDLDYLHSDAPKTKTVTVERRKYVTNVIIYMQYPDSSIRNHRIYSFIHRIYPSLGSIIGGFDLGPCMVAYDGQQIWATQLGAWSIANNMVIADISTRSTTFGQRLKKYRCRGFSIVFPGMEKELNQYGLELDLDGRLKILYQHMKSLGLKFDLSEHEYQELWDETPGDARDWYMKMREHYSIIETVELPDMTIIEQGQWWHMRLKYEGGSDYGNWPLALNNIVADRNVTCLMYQRLDSVTATIDNTSIRRMLQQPDCFAAWWEYNVKFPFVPCNDDMRTDPLYREVCSLLSGNTWMTENPQRQWTSSFNPIVTKAAEYWGMYHREHVFRLGVDPDVEVMLRLGLKDPNSALSILTTDMFNVIMRKVCLLN